MIKLFVTHCLCRKELVKINAIFTCNNPNCKIIYWLTIFTTEDFYYKDYRIINYLETKSSMIFNSKTRECNYYKTYINFDELALESLLALI